MPESEKKLYAELRQRLTAAAACAYNALRRIASRIIFGGKPWQTMRAILPRYIRIHATAAAAAAGAAAM